MCWVEAMACEVPKIIGSNCGIGKKLPIDKIEKFRSIGDAILKAEKKQYRKLIPEELSWEKNVNDLLFLWNKK
jgi:hypothetical protein